MRPGLTSTPPLGKLVEDDAPLVGGHEQRIVDLQLEVVAAGQALRFEQLDAREIGHRAARTVARADLHDDMGDDGHGEDDGRDEQQIVGQRKVALETAAERSGILHGFGTISGPSCKGRPQ